jgi:hypothetical protein
MLRPLEPSMTFKGDKAKEFFKERNGRLDLLHEYLQDPTVIPEDL